MVRVRGDSVESAEQGTRTAHFRKLAFLVSLFWEFGGGKHMVVILRVWFFICDSMKGEESREVSKAVGSCNASSQFRKISHVLCSRTMIWCTV